MSYKTNAIGNRLGISMGWTDDLYPNLNNYAARIQNNIRLYWFIKEYLTHNQVMLIQYKYLRKQANNILYLAIYKYQSKFNQKKRITKRKKKIIYKMQSFYPKYRKTSRKQFWYHWKKVHRYLKTNFGWRVRKQDQLKSKRMERLHERIKSPKRRVPRRLRIKGWTFLTAKNQLLKINKIKRFQTKHVKGKKRQTVLKQFVKQNKTKIVKRIKLYMPEFYNNYVALLALRFKLRVFLQSKGFDVTTINITEPIKVANKKAIKIFSQSNWYRRLKRQRFFTNTIRLLHLIEKYPNATVIADHFAKELLAIRKKHWNLIRAFSTILKYWRFHDAKKLNKKEGQRHKGRDKKTRKIKRWIPRYKLYSAHDTKKAIRGIKISIKGKINATDRTRVKIIQEGIIPIQSFNKHVTYGIAHARVKTGAFGIKVWLFT